ncbi:MAG TPA: hypothetical protein VN999_17915 [Thermoanaerobaculia bacterium]|nr:hypothetical protein [Thermoanaerobaculia bacterium]
MERQGETTGTTPTRDGKAEAARVREALRSIIDVAGMSLREIERVLARQGHGFDMNRMLTGKFEVKLYQILDVLGVLEIHPVEFFRLVFREPTKQSAILLRMREIFGAVRPAAVAPAPSAPTPGVTLDTLQRRVEELARQLDQLARRGR